MTKFPCYRRINPTYYNSARSVGTVVKFINATSGFVINTQKVKSDQPLYKVGDFSENWTACHDKECWFPVRNTKTLDKRPVSI